MRNNSRIFVYILLNIVISAVTVLIVLWIWEASRPTLPVGQEDTFRPASNTSPNSDPTAKPAEQETEPAATLAFVTDELQVSIHAIVGAGNLDVEYVEIHNQSEGPLDMTGWQLIDQDGNVFSFPALILNQGGAIKVLSKPGNDTVIELYWQSNVPIWQSGETASLLTSEGAVVTTYSIP